MKKIVVGVSTVLLFVLAMGSSNGRSDATKIFNQKKLPTFNRVLLLEQTSETSANVSIGDLNGDGKSDLAVANPAGSVSVLLNTSGGQVKKK